MSDKETTSWIDDGQELLSSLMDHDNAKQLIDSFYENNDTIDKKLHFKQIETNLLNKTYESIYEVFDDITTLFENAMKILKNTDQITEINEIFINYKNAYNKKKETNKNKNKPKLQQRKTRLHKTNSNITTKRRRSARLAKLKNTDKNDSDTNTNTNIDKKRKKKRTFTTMNETNNETNNDEKSNKIARKSMQHTSPKMKNNESKNDDEDSDDVDMTKPIYKYNLRSHTKSPSKTVSPLSKSKTPIMTSKIIKMSKKEENICKNMNINELVINFEDGCQDTLFGKFGITNECEMKYGCVGMCINGEFKTFNQDWISLNYYDSFKDLLPLIFCGVYDGHGILGHNASKYCGRHLPMQFMFELYKINSEINNELIINENSNNNSQDENKQNESAVLLAFKNALENIDNNLREISLNESKMFSTILERQGCESRLIDYGTTVNCLISNGYDIYIGNVGDSRCLLIEGSYESDNNNNNKWVLNYRQITSDHNPYYRLDERERVKKSNGQFFKQNDELRLYPSNKTFKEARRKGLAINMTRAVGHSVLSKHGLIAKPETYHVKINKNNEYIFIMASDGVWDILTNEKIFKSVKAIYNTFIHNQTNETLEHLIATEIIENSQKEWQKKRVGDNISVVVTRIVKK